MNQEEGEVQVIIKERGCVKTKAHPLLFLI